MASDTLNQLREHLLLLERTLEEHLSAQARADQLVQVQHDRDRRLLAELAQQVEALGRSIDAAVNRTQALAEEIRRERDSRAPLGQAIDDLQRVQTALQGRLSVVDEITRRYSAVTSALEQSTDKRQAEIGRLDNQVKLIELRVTRELAEFRSVSEEWTSISTEQLKQVAVLAKQVQSFDEAHRTLVDHVADTREGLDRTTVEIGRLDAEIKSNRVEFSGLSETSENLARRIEVTGAGIFSLNERVAATDSRVDAVNGNAREIAERLDALASLVARGNEERERQGARIEALAAELRAIDRQARERSNDVVERFDLAVADLRGRAEKRARQSIEHLRQVVVQLEDQLRELEPESAKDLESP